MKKIVIFIMLCVSISALAEDIIITRKSEKISAVILEVNVDDVKYKKQDNPNGPTYTMLKSDIASILYSSGTVDVFEAKNSKTISEAGYATYSLQGNDILADGNIIPEGRYLELASRFCPIAYEQYKKGKSTRAAGIALMSTGCFFLAGGLISGGVVDGFSNYAEFWAPFLGIGFASTVIGIPLYCTGNKLRKESVRTFNATNHPISLNLNYTGNGLGLALNF